MAHLTPHPLKVRASQAGASNFWEYAGSQGFTDELGGVALIEQGGDATLALGAETGAGPWVQAGRLSPNRWLSANDHPLPQSFTVFARFRVDRSEYLPGVQSRSLLAIGLPEWADIFGVSTLLSVRVESRNSNPPSGRPTLVLTVTRPKGETGNVQQWVDRLPLALDNTVDAATCYVAICGDGVELRALLVVPGSGTFVVEGRYSGGARLAGFGGAGLSGTYAGFDHHTSRNLRLDCSDMLVLPRAASTEEVTAWARLVEIGRSSDGLLLPLNNSKTVLEDTLPVEGSVLTIPVGEALRFCSPGANEKGRVTLVDASDPDLFEICALFANDGASLEVLRAQEGTAAREWPAGTRVHGWITQGLLAPAERSLIPSFGTDNYLSPHVRYAEIIDPPFIPRAASDIGAVSSELFNQLSAQMATLTARVVELERGPLWSSVRQKPAIPSMPADIGAAPAESIAQLLQLIADLQKRIAALESGAQPESNQLTDAAGNVLTDASGVALSAPAGSTEFSLIDAAGLVLTDASGNTLSAPDTRLTDQSGFVLQSSAGEGLLAA